MKNEVVQKMSLNIKFSYLAENFSRSNSYLSILTPTFLRDGFLNSGFQNPSESSAGLFEVTNKRRAINALIFFIKGKVFNHFFMMLPLCDSVAW